MGAPECIQEHPARDVPLSSGSSVPSSDAEDLTVARAASSPQSSPSVQSTKPDRDTAFLDGLRGVCSLVVSLFHNLKMFYLQQPVGREQGLATWIWTAGLLNGPFMVSIFFVLSGRVLADGFYHDGQRNYDRLSSALLRRPLRLGLPVLAFHIIISFLYWIPALPLLDPTWTQFVEEHVLGPSENPLMNCHAYAESTFATPLLATLEVAFGDFNDTCQTLWTIGKEFMGSYLVFMLVAFGPRYRWAGAAFMILLAIFFSWRSSWMAQFTSGVLLCHVQHAGWSDIVFHREVESDRSAVRIAVRIARGLLLGAIFVCGASVWLFVNRELGSVPINLKWIAWMDLNFEFPLQRDIARESIAAAFFVLWLENCAPARKVFASAPLRYMGKLSFSYYLWHGWVFGNLGSWILMKRLENAEEIIPRGEYAFNVWGIVLPANVLAAALVAHIFRKTVDKPSTQLGRHLIRALEARLGWRDIFGAIRDSRIAVTLFGPSTGAGYLVLPQATPLEVYGEWSSERREEWELHEDSIESLEEKVDSPSEWDVRIVVESE